MTANNEVHSSGVGDAADGQRSVRALAILALVCVAVFFGVLNAAALGVILPEIGGDLSVEPGLLAWVMTGFLLVYGVAIPIYGRLSDLYGTRPLFLLGLGLFAVGSLLSALSPSFAVLLISRIVQASGGAAVPGLGMVIASRAFPPAQRGVVLGVIATTIGVGAGVGPLLGGALSDLAGWRAIFALTSVVALAVPIGLKVLPKDEDLSGEPLDLPGAVFMGLMVAGALLAVSEASRSGLTSVLVIGGVVTSVVAFLALMVRQTTAQFPFVPRELVESRRFLALVSMSFLIMAANLAVLVGVPLLLTSLHGLSAIEIGVVLLPGALLMAVLGLTAGRMVDRVGARLPARIGAPLMLIALLGLSIWVDADVVVIAALVAVLGAGFALVNTPIAAAVSLVVDPKRLASALSINSMLFFIGGSFGAAIVIALGTGGGDVSSLNPLHDGAAAGYSDAYLLMAGVVVVVFGLTLALPAATQVEAEVVGEEADAREPAPITGGQWVPNCSIPWTPQCTEGEAAPVPSEASPKRAGAVNA